MNATERSVVTGLLALVLLQVGAFAAWNRWFRHEAAPAAVSAQGVIPQMQGFTRQRRYDDAVRLGLESARAGPRDYRILQEVALVYLRRAQVESSERERSAQEATSYAEKALALSPDDLTNLYDSARVFEIAGDFSAAMKCAYYTRSADLFRQRGPQTQRASETVKNEQQFLWDRVKGKMEKNGCR